MKCLNESLLDKNVKENIFSLTFKFVSVHWLHNNLLNSQSNFQCINKPRPCQIYHEMKSQRTRNYFETQILIKTFLSVHSNRFGR